MTEQKNIFISHVFEDNDSLADLKNLLKKGGITARDYSINADNENKAKNEDYIKNQILKPRIDACSALVVYVSPETKDSKYVNWEIEYAAQQGIRIVGVWAQGEAGCDIPEALDKYNDAIVGWKGAGIVDAINGQVDGCENPDGTSFDRRPIKRHPC